MSLNSTPRGERIHIGFFGRRNAGKSSLVNAFTGQELSIVSDVKGTTTDLVYKSMELLPMGPVVIIDTPGYDDEGELGELRIKRTKQALNRSDVAILVVDAAKGIKEADNELIELFISKNIPYIIAYNKCDKVEQGEADHNSIFVSAKEKIRICELKELVANINRVNSEDKPIVADLIHPDDVIVLVTPIDSSAPKGRMILPQVQTIRDILDADAVAVVTKETQLSEALKGLNKKPAMVITDSQAFGEVAKNVPEDIALTSFSILMARHKGFLKDAVECIGALESIQDGDVILISEGCNHHRQCEDIGTVKIPNWLRAYSGKDIRIDTSSGRDFPEDLSGYKMIIHCGGCMLNEREISYRRNCAMDAGVPFINYGTAIAMMKGIFSRSIEVFKGNF